jgi:hypothetical protein
MVSRESDAKDISAIFVGGPEVPAVGFRDDVYVCAGVSFDLLAGVILQGILNGDLAVELVGHGRLDNL